MFSHNRKKRQGVPWRPNQNGAALMLTMLLLAASAVVGLSFAVQNVVENRVAGNQKSAETAFGDAETGLAHGVQLLIKRFHTENLAKISNPTANGRPTWDFLFNGVNGSSCNDCRSKQKYDPYGFMKSYCGPGCYPGSGAKLPDVEWKETIVLPNGDDQVAGNHNYMVYASNYGGDDWAITVRSVGFGPRGAEQVVEVRLKVSGGGSRLGYYSQEGGGPNKANTNILDKGKVSSEQVDTGSLTLR